MTERKDDGGAAFPFVTWRSPDGMLGIQQDAGMSLRDWFAGQALVGILSANPTVDATELDLAATAYVFADAMLAERAKK